MNFDTPPIKKCGPERVRETRGLLHKNFNSPGAYGQEIDAGGRNGEAGIAQGSVKGAAVNGCESDGSDSRAGDDYVTALDHYRQSFGNG